MMVESDMEKRMRMQIYSIRLRNTNRQRKISKRAGEREREREISSRPGHIFVKELGKQKRHFIVLGCRCRHSFR